MLLEFFFKNLHRCFLGGNGVTDLDWMMCFPASYDTKDQGGPLFWMGFGGDMERSNGYQQKIHITNINLYTRQFCERDLFGMVSSRDPFKGCKRDLQLGELYNRSRVTLNHLVFDFEIQNHHRPSLKGHFEPPGIWCWNSKSSLFILPCFF